MTKRIRKQKPRTRRQGQAISRNRELPQGLPEEDILFSPMPTPSPAPDPSPTPDPTVTSAVKKLYAKPTLTEIPIDIDRIASELQADGPLDPELLALVVAAEIQNALVRRGSRVNGEDFTDLGTALARSWLDRQQARRPVSLRPSTFR